MILLFTKKGNSLFYGQQAIPKAYEIDIRSDRSDIKYNHHVDTNRSKILTTYYI